MQPGGGTPPATLGMIGHIVAEARTRIGEHLQVGVAVNRRRVLSSRVAKSNKNVVVVLDSRIGRWLPWVLDFQCNVVVRVENIALKNGWLGVRHIDKDCGIASTAEQVQACVVPRWRARDRVGHRTAIPHNIAVGNRCRCAAHLDLLSHIAKRQRVRHRHAGPFAADVQCIQSVLRVVAHRSLVEMHLPAGGIAVLGRRAKSIAITPMVLVRAVSIRQRIDDRVLLGATVPTDVVVLHQQTALARAPVVIVGIPSRRGIAQNVHIVHHHAISGWAGDAIRGKAVNMYVRQGVMRRCIGKRNPVLSEVLRRIAPHRLRCSTASRVIRDVQTSYIHIRGAG